VKDFKARMVTEKIIQNLADVDFYKLTMLQFIWFFFRNTQVIFRFNNRTDVNLANYIDADELRRQLERVRALHFPKWCARKLKTRYGTLFRDEFLKWLVELQLTTIPNVVVQKGQMDIRVQGTWAEVMLWETITMCIVNRLYFLAKMNELGLKESDVLAEGHNRALQKFLRLASYPLLFFVDFGTRRRWSFAHQLAVVKLAMATVPDQIKGTSNVYLGLKLDLPLIGTMAHELTMAFQALFWEMDEANDRLQSQKKLWQMWQEFYGGKLTVALPDTYGNDFGLEDFAEFAATWMGQRHDSGEPINFGEKVIAFYQRLQIDPKTKLLVFSDGLTDESMIELWIHFHERIVVAPFGWGTHLTNDMGFDRWSDGNRGLKPLSIVMKLVGVFIGDVIYWTVKLSDNPAKATGPRDKVERIMRKTSYDPSVHLAVECVV